MTINMIIREVKPKELESLLALYQQLHDNPMPDQNKLPVSLWEEILEDKKQRIIVAIEDDKIVSSCVIVIVPNLTHKQRPYAFIENVITDVDYRKKGMAQACLSYAKEIAVRENCYKIMLLTGAKDNGTLRFYEKAGYNRHDKTAFIQWLNL